jgi:16S rRNA (guanine527-N7)-methyltransferase
MDIARIATLLEPFLEQPLPPSRLDQISIYIDLLQNWNARINLTAIRHEEEIVTRHFGESLFMARHLFPTSVARAPSPASSDSAQTTPVNPPHVLDIGSGAGFPAIPLKLWAPHIHLTLIESNHKKVAFLREVARALTLTDINVIADRVETLAASPGRAQAEVVTLRAVERFDTILQQALAFLAPTATLALLIGSDQIPQLAALTALNWQPPIPVPHSKRRVLSIGVLE